MPGAHRNGDPRFCGASTIVEGQSTVFVNGQLWAVDNDPEDHGNGHADPVYGALNVYCEGKLVIVAPGDKAKDDDDLEHIAPDEDAPASGSGDTFAYG